MQDDSYKNLLDTKLFNQLNEAVKKSQYDQIKTIFEANKNNPFLNAIKQQAVFDRMLSVATQQEAAQLGTYVNRSMVVASRLNQTQDLIEELIQMRRPRRSN